MGYRCIFRVVGSIAFCFVFLCHLSISGAEETPASGKQQKEAGNKFHSAYGLFRDEAYPEAIRAFNQFVTENSDSILRDYAYYYIAVGFMQIQDYENARKAFEYLRRVDPHSLLLAEVKFLEADSYFYQGHYDTAIQRYLALKEEKKYQKHRRMPELYLKLGQCYEKQGQLTSALETYHQAWFTYIYALTYSTAKANEDRLLRQHPALLQDLTTKQIIASVDRLIESGKARDALPWLNRLHERKRSAALEEKIALTRAYAYYVLRDNQRAVAYYRQFLRDYPNSKSLPYVLDRIGRLYLRQENMDAFLRIYRRLLRDYPKSEYAAGAIRLKGKEFELQGKFRGALSEFDKFIEFHPRNSLISDVFWHIGWCHYQLQEYQAALKMFDRLVRAYPKSSHKEEALYWAGRSAEQLKKFTQATTYYLTILRTNQNTYFGILSQQAFARIAQIQPDLALQGRLSKKKPLPFDQVAAFSTEQGILHQQKARELQQIGIYDLAAEELAYAVEKDTADHSKYLALAQLYHQAGKYHELVGLIQRRFWYWIVLGDDTVPQTFWEYAYPLSFPQIVNRYASSTGLDPLFVQAVMLAESVFDPRAFSPAGAMGLMQLMPTTGSKLAERLGLSIPRHEMYFQPEVNILLGTTYLKGLLELFDGQLPPVIASYNAGEHRVSTWWQERYKKDAAEFIAMIPYEETMSYVQKVLWYYQEYQRIYKNR